MTEPQITKQEFAAVMGYLSAGCSRKMDQQQMRVFYDALNDLPAAVLMASCRRAIQQQTDNWLPSVGLIRSFAVEAISGALPNYGDEWANVRAAVRRWGYMRKAEGMASLGHVARLAVEAVGGWQVLCDSENPTILGAQFRTAYEAAAKRESEMRRIGQELRPRITAGPRVTPRIETQAETRRLVNEFAGAMKRIEGPKDGDAKTVQLVRGTSGQGDATAHQQLSNRREQVSQLLGDRIHTDRG